MDMREDTDVFRDIKLHRAILRELGYEIGPQSTILDFGCDKGQRVYQYRKLGWNAFGTDIVLTDENDVLRRIDTKSGKAYRIPFEDEMFDFVFSEYVLEHVNNYDAALSEIWRVLKPDGCSLHIFPPKYMLIEPHTFVPFGGMFQSYTWLYLWAFLGVRNSFQKNLSHTEIAKKNLNSLKTEHNYMSKRALRSHVLRHFHNITFAEEHLIKHSYGYARYIHPLVRLFPFVSRIYSSLYCRVVFFKKNINSTYQER